MDNILILSIIIFISSLCLTYLIKNYAIKKSLVAEVNERSSHTIPTPHGGGIAIAVTWFIGISYLFFTSDINDSLYFALMVGMVVSVVSYLDDLFELSAKVRLMAQSFVSLLGLYFLGGFESFELFFLSIENQLFTNIFAFLMIIWFINLYNFLDGIDGYAGSEAVFLGIAGFLLFGGNHFLILVVAVLGFLFWNWHKARIFMGDVGSTLLGYNVAVFTIHYANQESSNFWIWIILFGVFWFDATLTLYRRYTNAERLGQAHKKHGYQRLTQSGYAHDKVVVIAMCINVLLFALVYIVANIFLATILSVILLYTSVKLVDKKKAFK